MAFPMTSGAAVPHTRRSKMWPTRLPMNHVAKLAISVWETMGIGGDDARFKVLG